MSIFFYISGHGFGHAVRQIEIINALGAMAPELPIFVRTMAPEWLFTRTARAAITLLPGDVDTGVVQIDSLRLEERETIVRAAEFYRSLDRRVAAETEILRQHGARLVISDAPPLACAAAAAAGLPAFVCANFTWDWIYNGYSEPLAAAPDLIPTIRRAYSLAAAAWRLPMHGGFDAINTVVDVPLVARHARRDLPVADLRRALGLPVGKPLALASFGGVGLDGLPLDRLDCVPEWHVVITRREFHEHLPPGIVGLSENLVYQRGLRYEDVVRAVDVVVTKPGYGIISDCVANDTALLYTSRGRFVEYDVLVAEMPRVLRCAFLDQPSLRAGRWKAALESVLTGAPPSERPRTDGAPVVSALILNEIRHDHAP